MTNTLLRSGRSAVLNMARDFSCAIVTADNELLASAEGLPGPRRSGWSSWREAMTELHDDIREGDAFLHNDPYLGNTHSADHAILVPVFHDGEHVFTACAKAHQADCGNSLPTTYMPGARDVYEEGALNFPCVRIQRDYRDVEDIIRMCRRRIRVPEQWYGDYLAALGAARIAERRLKELLDAVRRRRRSRRSSSEWFDYSERRMAEAIKQLPGGTLVGRTTHDPYPGLPDGIPLEVKVHIDAEDGLDRDRPPRQPGQLCRAASTSRGRARRTTSSPASSTPSIPTCRTTPAASGESACCCARAASPASRRFPHSCSMATTNVADRLVCATQAAFADIGEGFGLAEGCVGLPPAFAVVSGHDFRLDDAPYVNQLFLGGGRRPGRSGQPTAGRRT